MKRHHMLSAALTCIGVVGETFILWHSLVHTYPFKVLTYPSPRFFAILASVLAPVMSLMFFGLALRWSRRSPIATPALLISSLPIVFTAAVTLVTILSHGTRVPAGIRNFDGYTIPQALGEFAAQAIRLSAVGLISGGMSAALVALIRPRHVAGV